MGDKIRGAMFNMLGNIEQLTVLDAFAGSGALSFEALSRGAVSSVAVDIDRGANTTIVKNIKSLGLEGRVKAVKADVGGWSINNPEKQFDLVLCDPPYDSLRLSTLQKLVKHVRQKGLFILSWPGGLGIPAFAGLEQISQKSYGDAVLVIYRKTPQK